jgi:hypothetical protein
MKSLAQFSRAMNRLQENQASPGRAGSPLLAERRARSDAPYHIELATAEPRRTRRTTTSRKAVSQGNGPRRLRRARQRRREKPARIDLGLAVLSALSVPGERKLYHEIAAWCDCTEVFIRHIELCALNKLKRKLAKTLTPREMERCKRFFVNNPIPAQPQEETRPATNSLVESWSGDGQDCPPIFSKP